MTYVIREVYGTSQIGVKRFLMNRFLRIYPLYWLVAVATIVLLICCSLSGPFVDPAIKIPSDFIHWIVNVQIIGLARGVLEFHISGQRLVSVAWSLHVELIFYLLMSILLARKDWIIVLWCMTGLVYTVFMVEEWFSWQDRYFTLAAASLPFSLGSVLYLLHSRKMHVQNRLLIIFAPVIFLVHALASSRLYGAGDAPMGLGFYISLMLAVLAVWSLGSIRSTQGWARVDRWAGDMSYPLFLLHMITGMMVSSMFNIGAGPVLFLMTLLAATILSHFFHVLVEGRVEKLRSRIRRGEMLA